MRCISYCQSDAQLAPGARRCVYAIVLTHAVSSRMSIAIIPSVILYV